MMTLTSHVFRDKRVDHLDILIKYEPEMNARTLDGHTALDLLLEDIAGDCDREWSDGEEQSLQFEHRQDLAGCIRILLERGAKLGSQLDNQL